MRKNPNHLKKYLQSEVPLRRLAEPREIADAVIFLTSARARFISGALLCVDGAQTR